MIPRLFAATGAVLLWAYARACRERNATQQRLARANLLRAVSARHGRTDSRGDRTVTIDITPDTSKLERILDELSDRDPLTQWQREVVRRSFSNRPVTHRDVQLPVRRSW